jgi:hypothetical protein
MGEFSTYQSLCLQKYADCSPLSNDERRSVIAIAVKATFKKPFFFFYYEMHTSEQ